MSMTPFTGSPVEVIGIRSKGEKGGADSWNRSVDAEDPTLTVRVEMNELTSAHRV